MSNQKGRQSGHGSISRRVEDNMHAEQGDQRGQQQLGDVGRGYNSRGHCERCREEQMLTGDEIRRFDHMDEIVEQRSDLSSQEKPRNGESSPADEGIEGASPDRRRSSMGLASGQPGCSKSQPYTERRLNQDVAESPAVQGRGRDPPGGLIIASSQERNIQTYLQDSISILLISQAAQACGPRQTRYKEGCNTASSGPGHLRTCTPTNLDGHGRRSMQPSVFERMIKTPMHNRLDQMSPCGRENL